MLHSTYTRKRNDINIDIQDFLPHIATMNYKPIRHVFEKPIHYTHIGLSVQMPWRQLPSLLHDVKRMNITIHKAKMVNDWTTMYMRVPYEYSTEEKVHMVKENLVQTLEGTADVDLVPLYSLGLPASTTIHVYNNSVVPYTIMDFSCSDRTGLFCEILEFLSSFDIHVEGAYINTIGNIVNNIFYISRNGSKLSEEYIVYLNNLFEYELKKKQLDHNNY